MTLLVVGDVVTDIVAVPTAALLSDTDTGARIFTRAGGAGANAAAWAGHHGATVRMLGRVGSDSVDWHRDHLARHGVEPVLRVDDERPTAIVIAIIAPDGERGMITDRGAGADLGLPDWDEDLLTGVTHLHLSGYLWFAEAGARLGDHLLTLARERGITTSVDPASTGFLREFGIAEFLRRTAGVDVVFPNADEARMLAAEPDVDAATVHLSQHYGLVATTVGAGGAILASGGTITSRHTAQQTTVVDLVGAGDAFAGAFLAARLRGDDPVSAGEAACRAGADAVRRSGGRP